MSTATLPPAPSRLSQAAHASQNVLTVIAVVYGFWGVAQMVKDGGLAAGRLGRKSSS